MHRFANFATSLFKYFLKDNIIQNMNSSETATKKVGKKSSTKEYFRNYYRKNKEHMDRKRAEHYYMHRYSPEQLKLLQALKPTKYIPQPPQPA
jgi:hypothetical protein